MHTKIWNLRYDTWGASDIHNEHFARFIFIYHFSIACLLQIHSLHRFLSQQNRKWTLTVSMCTLYKYNPVTGIIASNVVTRPFFNDSYNAYTLRAIILISQLQVVIIWFSVFFLFHYNGGVSANETASTNNSNRKISNQHTTSTT